MDTAPVFMESDHTQVHLALIINKDVEFESFIEQLRRLHPQIGSTVQIDDKQFKMLQFHQGQLVVDVVCLGAQGFQSFAIRATAYLQKYQPRYTLLLGTGVSGQLAPPMVCYIVMACNGDEPCSVSYQSLQQRQWFGPAVQRGCAVSSCVPREQQMTPEEWNKLKSGRRDLLVAEMECSAFFESCNFLGVSCLGCLKGIVESDNDTVHLDDVWIRIAEMVQNRVLPNLSNLQFRQATVTFDGERIAEQYVNNFLINISTCLSRTEKLLTIIKVDEDKLDRTAYPVMPITKCRLGMTDVTIHSDEQARTWTVYKRANEDRLYDIPTCLNIIREDIERTTHYVKFWEKLQKEIQKRGLNINIVKESDLLQVPAANVSQQ